MPEVPEHDADDELERTVAHDESVTAQERQAMLYAYGASGHAPATRPRVNCVRSRHPATRGPRPPQ